MARAPADQLDGYSLADLVKLQLEVDAAIAERRETEKAALKAKLGDMAAAAGFDITDIFGGARKGKATRGSARYRNPDDPSQTWTGRGRKPNWLVDRLKKRGASMEDFAI